MALQLVRHAFAMIFGNLGQALRVSFAPFALLFVAGILFSKVSGITINAAMNTEELSRTIGSLSGSIIMLFLAFCVFSIFVLAWMAVSWHRFILKEEYVSLIPAIAERPIWPYVGRSLIYGFLLVLLSIPVGFVVISVGSLLANITGAISMLSVSGLIGSILLAFILMRWSIALPAIAVGKRLTLSEAWSATQPHAMTILGVAAILTLVNFLPDLLLGGVYIALPLIGMAINLCLQWLTMMLGLSVLTTLYGHIIERRPLIG